MAGGYRVGVDVGGTFTDVVLVGPGGVVVEKLPSTPADFGEAIVSGVAAALARAGAAPADLEELVHATTVATNAILEHRGARTALLTTRGFRDVLEIRRMRVPRLYDPLWEKPRPLVERALRLEIDERVDHTGGVLRPLDEGSVRCAVERLREERVESVAVCLLHAYRNPAHERRVGEIVREMLPDAYLSLSSEVLPRIREYERTSTTVINSYVGPAIAGYLSGLEERLGVLGARPRLLVMQSSGGAMSARVARQRPAYAVESGPAAGVIAGARLGGEINLPDLITLDMGGTTAKGSIVERGAIQHTSETEVGAGVTIGNRLNRGGGYLLSVPAIDICEVGAGGGSIAGVDPGGALRVGPESAGAEPGPACYARGGVRATLTDANVALGYLPGDALLGGDLPIDREAARAAVLRDVADPLGISLEAGAWAVHRLAVASMVRVVRAVSSERGRDPRRFHLAAFGGNGPLHAAAVAGDLGIPSVVVPPRAGVFSAWGLLRADLEHHFGRTILRRIDSLPADDLAALYRDLEAGAAAELVADGFPAVSLTFRRHAELRYVGQSFELRVAAEAADPARLAASFAAEHERTYGHSFPGEPVEIVDLGVVVTALRQKVARPPVEPAKPASAGAQANTARSRPAYFGPDPGWLDTVLLARGDIAAQPHAGPAIVEEYDATTLVPPGWAVRCDPSDNLILESCR